MGYSKVLGAPQTGSISMHVLLSFSPNPIWWDVILFRNQKSERELQIKTPIIFLYKGKI
jgi:hypothetical protein